MLSKQEFDDFIISEIEKMKIDKWIEGEKIKCDPGVEYELYWVETYAKKYRYVWLNSKCKQCIYCKKCGYNATSACDKFEKK